MNKSYAKKAANGVKKIAKAVSKGTMKKAGKYVTRVAKKAMKKKR